MWASSLPEEQGTHRLWIDSRMTALCSDWEMALRSQKRACQSAKQKPILQVAWRASLVWVLEGLGRQMVVMGRDSKS